MSVAHRTLKCQVFSQLLSKKSKSRAWEHFGLPANESGQIVSEDIAVCKLSRSPVSAKSGSTSNLFGHLRLHHPLKHKRQKFMTDFQRLDDQASKRTTDSATKFLVCSMQPYNLVDRKEFINMVKVLNPHYSLPGRKHFTATAVLKLYDEVRDKIRQELSLINKDTISVTTDCWASIANTPNITITEHFITSEELLHGLKVAKCICNELEDEERSPQSPRVTTNGGKNTSLCLSNSMVEHFKIGETISGKSVPICKILLEYSNKKHLMLEGNEILALEDFTTATKLLEDISSLSGEQYTTASAVLPLYMKIKNNLQTKDEDSLLLKSVKSEILRVPN
ncbi:t-complex protein 1 subunit delta [Trichonephila clavipes]|nr:t-complex protein 1 subunit delta [Trichonephila clavipes]